MIRKPLENMYLLLVFVSDRGRKIPVGIPNGNKKFPPGFCRRHSPFPLAFCLRTIDYLIVCNLFLKLHCVQSNNELHTIQF